MDRWRSFFNKAGEDVWTIIEQAILLAAHDHPREFKEKRCGIAEILFERRPSPEDLPDTTRLSASVITNCAYRTGAGEARDDERASAACTKAQVVHDVCKDGVDTHVCMSTIVCNIKEAIANSMPDGAVVRGLQMLETLHIGVDVLKETEIGKQVNNLRKHQCKEIRLLAKGLVRHWKELVDDWVNRSATSGHAISERDTAEAERDLTVHDRDTNLLTDFPGESQHQFYFDVKGRESYLEAPEERGSSSRAELAGIGMVGRLEKPCSNANSIPDQNLLEDESNAGADKLTGGNISNGKATLLSRGYDVRKVSSDDSNASELQGDHCSQRQKQARPTTNQRFICYKGMHSERKLETASKRKPQDGLSQIENAKRQQVARPLNSKDFYQVGLLQSKVSAQNGHWNQGRN